MLDNILNLISELESRQAEAKGIQEYEAYQFSIDRLYKIVQK